MYTREVVLILRVRPTLGSQRSRNKRAVVLCAGRAAASCLAQQSYALVQQLSSFRVACGAAANLFN